MNPRLAATLVRLDRMTPRERVVVTVCVCALSWFVLDTFFITPGQRDIATYGQLAMAQQQAFDATRMELEGLSSGRVPPGDPALREQLVQLDKDNVSADASLRASQQYLVPAATMAALLQDLLRRDRRLELVAMNTLPTNPILDTSTSDASSPVAESLAVAPTSGAASAPAAPAIETTMFRHGIELVVRGDYLSVLDYLHEVEKLPWQMYWGAFAMDAGGTGKPVFSVRIFTLSLEKSWLQL